MMLVIGASEAVLMQMCPDKDGPVPWMPEEVTIYFLSHRLSWTQQRWPVIEKEAFAILYAVQKLDYYLSGAVFNRYLTVFSRYLRGWWSVLKTDHQPLLEAEWTNKKIQQWALKLKWVQL